LTADYLVKKVEIKFAILLDICMLNRKNKVRRASLVKIYKIASNILGKMVD